MNTPAPAAPIPLGPVIRVVGPAPLAGDALVFWEGGAVVVRLASGDVTLAPRSRGELLERYRATLVGDAETGWEVSDGRLLLYRPGGSTLLVTPDPTVTDEVARLLIASSAGQQAAAGVSR